MKSSGELKALARMQLHGSWLATVGTMLVYSVILCVSGFTVIGPWVIGGPLTLGFSGYFLKKARGESVKLENLLDGFNSFGSSFLLYLLEIIFIFLWSLLFLIPGIVKCFSYSMAFFILRDNPGIGSVEAITRSRKMMDGHKGRLFCLCLSFIGWCLLCTFFTFGIGFLWLCPYMYLSIANFYEDLKQHKPDIFSATV